MPLHTFDPYKVQECKALKDMPRHTEALELLNQIVRQVQPIMKKRKLVVPLVKEFFPRSPRLLGLNYGGGNGSTREICVRLRPASDRHSFLPLGSLLQTMLHELTHNHISPHDATFYAMLAEMEKECEDLMARGIAGTGEGFDAPAAGKVGGRWRNPSTAERQSLMLKAAEGRARQSSHLNRLMPSGANRLGGKSSKNMTPKEAAAWAAEQRMKDREACGCSQEPGTTAAYDDRRGEIIVLDDSDGDGPSPSRATASGPLPAVAAGARDAPGGASVAEGLALLGAKRGLDVRGEEEARRRCHAGGRGWQGGGAGAGEELIDLTVSDDEGGPSAPAGERPAKGVGRRNRGRETVSPWEWVCPACTFKNPPFAPACDMCSTTRI